MRHIDGRKALEEILKIGKAIYIQEKNIRKSKIWGEHVNIEILPAINIYDIVAKLTNNVLTRENAIELNEIFKKQWGENECTAQEGDTTDLVIDVISDYYEEEIELGETISCLLNGGREGKD